MSNVLRFTIWNVWNWLENGYLLAETRSHSCPIQPGTVEIGLQICHWLISRDNTKIKQNIRHIHLPVNPTLPDLCDAGTANVLIDFVCLITFLSTQCVSETDLSFRWAKRHFLWPLRTAPLFRNQQSGFLVHGWQKQWISENQSFKKGG
jgi:hypothetical protein